MPPIETKQRRQSSFNRRSLILHPQSRLFDFLLYLCIKWVGRLEVSEKPFFSSWNTDTA
jgi:hypothetical protein